jgi:hypothetical protein
MPPRTGGIAVQVSPAGHSGGIPAVRAQSWRHCLPSQPSPDRHWFTSSQGAPSSNGGSLEGAQRAIRS